MRMKISRVENGNWEGNYLYVGMEIKNASPLTCTPVVYHTKQFNTSRVRVCSGLHWGPFVPTSNLPTS